MKTNIVIALVCMIILLGACKNHSSYEPINNADSAQLSNDNDTTTTKLIKTANIKFKVKDVRQTSERIAALTNQYKGIVIHHEYNAQIQNSHDIHLTNDSVMRITAQSLSATMVIKVPAEGLEVFMNEVGKLGLYVDLRRMDVEDKTFDYLSSKLKLQSRTQLIKQQRSGKVIIKNPGDVLSLKDNMIDEKINNLLINDQVKYSIAQLDLYQSNIITKEVIANDNPTEYQLPFVNRIGLAFENGWYLLKEIIVGLINLWAIICLGMLAWYFIRMFNGRKIRLQDI